MKERETTPAPENVLFGDFAPMEVRLQGKLRSYVSDFQILFQDDGIILRGFARTYHAKQMAQHAVIKETNLPILANEIEVH